MKDDNNPEQLNARELARLEREAKKANRGVKQPALEVYNQQSVKKEQQQPDANFECEKLMGNPDILLGWQTRYCATPQPQCLVPPPCANNNAQNEAALGFTVLATGVSSVLISFEAAIILAAFAVAATYMYMNGKVTAAQGAHNAGCNKGSKGVTHVDKEIAKQQGNILENKTRNGGFEKD